LDANGDVVVWNDAEAELVGVDRQEVVDPDGMIGEELYDGGRRTILAEKVLAHPQDAHEVYETVRLAEDDYSLLVGDGSPVFEDYLTQRESPAIPAKDECSDVSKPRTDTAGCNYVKRSGSGDGVLDGIQPDITEESRKNYSRQYEQGGRKSRRLR